MYRQNISEPSLRLEFDLKKKNLFSLKLSILVKSATYIHAYAQ